ncbi:hypothetical protein R9C00_02505 [Flammeovirgaceae bacterium SG7u.111]|nr:hypothetical protein [Flammeovirgaceae bacterium SG7u.132]WPO36311.1 hypothetical protein R9C00_02505 [Flammeovirgaceae bacterium SG7u.111]
MMKNSLLALACLVLVSISTESFSQVGKRFPEVSGWTLANKTMGIPSSTQGKVTLVGVAYSKKSDQLLKGWYDPIYKNFINPTQMAFFGDDPYDVNIYFVALLKGITKAATGSIVQKMENGIDKKYHENILMYQGKISSYKSELGLGKKDVPYFFVLDKAGKVLYKTSGAYSAKKMYEIKSAIDQF